MPSSQPPSTSSEFAQPCPVAPPLLHGQGVALPSPKQKLAPGAGRTSIPTKQSAPWPSWSVAVNCSWYGPTSPGCGVHSNSVPTSAAGPAGSGGTNTPPASGIGSPVTLKTTVWPGRPFVASASTSKRKGTPTVAVSVCPQGEGGSKTGAGFPHTKLSPRMKTFES